MSSDPLTELPTDDRARLEAVLVDFDLRWSPDAFGAAVEQLPVDGPFRDAALREMIKIDLERHARRGAPVSLHHYLEQFPELADAGTAPADLVAAEAAARDTLPLPSPSGSVHLPKVFGRYRIVRPLGRGGMGGVYLARDTELDREVALKVPRFPPDDAGAEERFAREAKAAATIDHPNVCRVYDVGRIDGLPYITMAYIEGPSLADVLRNGPLPSQRAVEVARDVARALAEAHRRGIVHRDLKPANILLQKDEGGRMKDEGKTESGSSFILHPSSLRPVVTDFGLASRTAPDDTRLTAEGTIAGTPPYMSPEQIAGERAGLASDVYSLGAVLYEMATGRPPFNGTRVEIFTQVLGTSPDPPSRVRPELDSRLDAIVLNALAKKPADRFADMGAFADCLDRWLGSDTRPRRRVLRRLAWVSAAAVVLCLLLPVLAKLGRSGTAPPTTSSTETTTATTAAKQFIPPIIQPVVVKLVPGKTATLPTGERVLAVTFSPDDRLIYAATTDQTQLRVRAWDATTGKEEPTKVKPLRYSWAAFSSDGRRFLTGGGDNDVQLMSVESGELIQKYETGAPAQVGAISRDGHWVILGVTTPAAGPRARVYDAESGELVHEYAGHEKDIRCVALSDNGAWAFSASPDRHTGWAVKTGVSQFGAGANTSQSAAFIPNSGRLAVAPGVGDVAVYDLGGVLPVETIQTGPRLTVTSLVTSPDGGLLTVGTKNRTLVGWDVAGRWRRWLAEVRDVPAPIVAAAFSSDGAVLVTADEHAWRVWRLPK